ncbi:MAG: S8 family serine peptidase [Elusimicrobia bacterium]|nr:S8 family serine peptidase [Candidatus Obscuribacterium magneticum]
MKNPLRQKPSSRRAPSSRRKPGSRPVFTALLPAFAGMTNTSKTLLALILILVPPSLALASESPLASHVLVRFKKDRSSEALAKIRQRFGVTPKRKIPKIDVEILPVPPGQTQASFLKLLQADPNVDFAEPNAVLKALTAPNDTNYPDQFYLHSDFIDVEGAWDIEQGSPATVIAVVDTGILLTHLDIVANLWNNPAPSGNSGLCGTTIEIDWNADGDCTDNPGGDLGPDQCASNDPTDNTSNNHGTHVAGIIAATTNNNLNMAGIARNCRVMAVKVLNSIGSGPLDAIAEGIIYAVDNGAAVINLSLGGSEGSSTLKAAVDYAVTNNVLVVAAAGNSGNGAAINFPAAYTRVIAVGASGNASNPTGLASFSCTGPEIDLVAPGIDILSLTLGGTNTGEGTSFAAPMVSGVAALIRSMAPTMPVDDVIRYIDFYATDLGPGGFDNSFGFGRLNAAASVQAAFNRTPFTSNPASPGETFPYPNPFNPTLGSPVTIALPESLGSENIRITIVNTAGERVKTLTDTNAWDGRSEDGHYVASGLYFYYAETAKGHAKGKLTLIK